MIFSGKNENFFNKKKNIFKRTKDIRLEKQGIFFRE